MGAGELIRRLGSILRRRYLPERSASFGLMAVWGMALAIALGGILCFLGIGSRWVLLTLATLESLVSRSVV